MTQEIQEYVDVLQYVGYELHPCNIGLAWNSPFRTIGDNPFPFNFHGLAFYEDKEYDYEIMKTDWDNLIALVKWIYPDKPIMFTNKEKNWEMIVNAARNILT